MDGLIFPLIFTTINWLSDGNNRSRLDGQIASMGRSFFAMKTLTTDETRNVILQATALNAQGQHREAIRLVQDNIRGFDPDLRFNGLKEVLRAGEALGDMPLLKTIAREIAREFPDMPSIQPYLQ